MTTPVSMYDPERDDAPSVRAQPAWADPVDVDPRVVLQRKMWKDGTLVTLEEAGVVVDAQGKPLNPHEGCSNGRKGRGRLGKWGVNHAADPIVTRDTFNGYQVLVVHRGDQEGLVPALPGGMVDELPDGTLETFTTACQRELCEEAVDDAARDAAEAVKVLLAVGTRVYTGVVAEPRNTDHAWIETCAIHAHLPEEVADALRLRANGTMDGECKSAVWMDITDSNLDLMYADHGSLVCRALAMYVEYDTTADLSWTWLVMLLTVLFTMLVACVA